MTDEAKQGSWQQRKNGRRSGSSLPGKQTDQLGDSFTPCEDERYLLDPGGGLALREDHEDDGEDVSWRRARKPGNRR